MCGSQQISVRFTDIGGTRLRYIAAGSGPPLVLLHTLRTQLDIFARVVPLLATKFAVYAPDYPGHGHSDAPDGRYDAAFFCAIMERFLERLELGDLTLAGISIGGVIALALAARPNLRVARAIAINPYDYAQGLGLSRSSLSGWLVTQAARIPILGEATIPHAPLWLVRRVLAGGVADASHLPAEFVEEIYHAGKRPGQARAFLRLLRHGRSWQDMQGRYGDIDRPVLLVWSDRDWSRPEERARTAALIPGVVTESVADAGHFLALDQPEELARLVTRFAEP